MSSTSIKVFAPASVSNVGPGFDIMGFAIDKPGDEIVLRKSSTKKIIISKISGDGGKLPYDIKKNTASVAILSLMKKYKINTGLNIEIRKKMGLGSGLGSSAASAVAAVYAANKLLELRLNKDELLEHAIAGERVASQAVHADNVAPALYGGFILISGYQPINIVKIKTPNNLYCTVIYPHVVIKTSEARKILPKSVPLKKTITHAGHASGLIYGLATGDMNLISNSLIDNIIEPVRSKLIPGYDEIKQAALNSGALGCSISGSGPSMFALSTNKLTAENIAAITQRVVKKLGLKSSVYISKINKRGPKIIG